MAAANDNHHHTWEPDAKLLWPEWLKLAVIIGSGFLWMALIYLVLIAIGVD